MYSLLCKANTILLTAQILIVKLSKTQAVIISPFLALPSNYLND